MITVEYDKTQYSLLSDALKAASEISKKKSKKGTRTQVRVSLEAAEYKIHSKLTIPAGVSIVGVREEHEVLSRLVPVASFSGNIMNSNSTGDSLIKDVEFNLPKTKKNDASKVITVGTGKTLEMEGVVIIAPEASYVKIGVSVGGQLVAKDCEFNGAALNFEKGGGGEVFSSKFLKESSEDEDSCAIGFYGDEVVIKDCEVTNFSIGICLHGNKAILENSKVKAEKVALDIDIGSVVVRSCSVEANSGRALKARAQSTSEILDTSINRSNIGVTLEDNAELEMKSCNITDIGSVVVRVEKDAKFHLSGSIINGVKEEAVTSDDNPKLDGITATKRGFISLKNCKILNVAGRGVVVEGPGSRCEFKDLTMDACGERSILVTGGGVITGSKAIINATQGVALHLNDRETTAEISDMQITGGATGVLIKQGPRGDFHKMVVKDTKKKGIEMSDCSGSFEKCNVFSPGAIAILIRKNARAILNSCNLRKATEAGAKVTGLETEVTFKNCGFLQNDVGLFADSAKTNVDGCTFVESSTKSIIIQNMKLKKSTKEGSLNKEAPIKLRWCNYIEPRLQGEEVCNEMELLTNATTESAFYGAFDYEYRMYTNTIMERMRQAKKYFESSERESDMLAMAIMLSVRHIYMLIPDVKKLLLAALAETPQLGMFCFVFKMGENQEGLYKIDELVQSWDNLPRTITYDEALKSLDFAFRKKHITEEVFDEQRDKVEEWQRTYFVESKFNRRRDYLLSTAAVDPLRCWYFLNKEQDPKLRTEVLKFLVAPEKPENDSSEQLQQHHFHGSWVGAWAIQKLGAKFLTKDEKPSRDKNKKLFKAWCDALLDKGRYREVIKAYADVKVKDDEDKLLLYEAFQMSDEKDKENKMMNLFPQKDYGFVVGLAASFFNGEGILPGFIRRYVDSQSDPEMVLEFLSNVPFREGHRREIVLAAMAQFYLPDDLKEPEINDKGNKSVNYDSCPICFVQKMFPWNELKLKNCKFDHRFCLDCIKESMSTGVPNLWGICPGEDDHGKSCDALATRRDMEMCGIEKEKIYNILERTVTERLRGIPDWRVCNAPGCIGGRSKVKLKYYYCRLCRNMVSLDGGESDPTIDIKLLEGLDSSESKRGNGIYRECYYCASSYEKGNACSTITCAVCKQTFSMSYGSDKITHRFDETGIQAQHYVPKKKGKLWQLGVFKDKKGSPLKLGQVLTDAEAAEVIRRAKLKLREYKG